MVVSTIAIRAASRIETSQMVSVDKALRAVCAREGNRRGVWLHAVRSILGRTIN